jgi:hypothetical protein
VKFLAVESVIADAIDRKLAVKMQLVMLTFAAETLIVAVLAVVMVKVRAVGARSRGQ